MVESQIHTHDIHVNLMLYFKVVACMLGQLEGNIKKINEDAFSQ